MLLSALELYIYVKFINLLIMAKKEKSKAYYINIGVLAKMFQVNKNGFSYGIAETILDDECDYIPIVNIKCSDEYIDLTTGIRKKTSYAIGVKQSLYRAVVSYDTETETFVFNTNRSKCAISKEILIQNFGKEIVKPRKN